MIVYIVLLTIFIIYIALSFILLRKPTYLHKRRRPVFIARNIAHRGGAAESIENSLHAFDTGLKNGVEMLELDCHLTKDNQVVVHHDFSIERTTGDDRFIRDIDYDDLPSINNNIELYYDSSTIISCDKNPESEALLRIPLLKDVFARYPTIPINIDVKANNDELIQQISRLTQEYQRESLTYWGSFNHGTCRKLTAENPHIVRFCSLKEVAGIVIAYWLGLLPFIPIKAGAFEIPNPGEVFQKATKNLNWKFKILLRIVQCALNNKTMFVHLQRRGIPVYVWILNNEQEYQHAFEQMSVTGNTNASLYLAGEQEEKLKALFKSAAEKVRSQNGNATIKQLFRKLREGLLLAEQGRQGFLDEFDQILQPNQRARFLLHLVQLAKESGEPVEQLIDSFLTQDGAIN
ncbi:unnamed protein product [Rotaria socialis]|uniref:GP-PDE domain-containing protein n=1 Tax=Rotaria socialis TaxID=392032 RepID=A0A818Q6D3_9BILA|nr:unnamed protein product [Rotaria socialis]